MEIIFLSVVGMMVVVPVLIIALSIQVFWECIYEVLKMAKQSGKYKEMGDRTRNYLTHLISSAVRYCISHARSCKHLWKGSQ